MRWMRLMLREKAPPRTSKLLKNKVRCWRELQFKLNGR